MHPCAIENKAGTHPLRDLLTQFAIGYFLAGLTGDARIWPIELQMLCLCHQMSTIVQPLGNRPKGSSNGVVLHCGLQLPLQCARAFPLGHFPTLCRHKRLVHLERSCSSSAPSRHVAVCKRLNMGGAMAKAVTYSYEQFWAPPTVSTACAPRLLYRSAGVVALVHKQRRCTWMT